MMVFFSDCCGPLVGTKVWTPPGSQALSSSRESKLNRQAKVLSNLSTFFFSVSHFISCKSNRWKRGNKHSQAEHFSAQYIAQEKHQAQSLMTENSFSQKPHAESQKKPAYPPCSLKRYR